jgi:cell division protein FtsI/penicillin-binding protein 2
MIKAYGFGQNTHIDLPAEEKGIFRPIENWTNISLSSLSIGYEISVTAIQMLQALNVVANGGIKVPPKVVKRVLSTEKTSISPPPSSEMVMSEKTAAQIARLLESVVLSGTGIKAQIEGYRVAGKTGTAQKFDPATGRYSSQMHIASFAGYVPVENPIMSMIVIIDDPKGLFYGGEVAAPVFQTIASETLRYLHIPGKRIIPERTVASHKRTAQ